MGCVAVIPARGGSKRIPHKNIKDFHGKPMIAHAIETAQESGVFDRIIVSTDDEKIAEVAKTYGAEVPFMRPAELSDDFAPTLPVIRHALEWLANDGVRVESACCLYSTSPFVRAADLRDAKGKLEISGAQYVVPVSEFAHPVQRALSYKGGNLKMVAKEHQTTRSQDLEVFYHDTGQFYFGTGDAWMREGFFDSSHTEAIIIPRMRVVDIDTPEDWDLAEKIYAFLQSEGA